MVCAPAQNSVRSWQNGVRAISDGTDVLGKMMCALMCALMCAPVAGVPVAQRISFSIRLAIVGIRSITDPPLETFSVPASHCQMDPGQVRKPRIFRGKPVKLPDVAFGNVRRS